MVYLGLLIKHVTCRSSNIYYIISLRQHVSLKGLGILERFQSELEAIVTFSKSHTLSGMGFLILQLSFNWFLIFQLQHKTKTLQPANSMSKHTERTCQGMHSTRKPQCLGVKTTSYFSEPSERFSSQPKNCSRISGHLFSGHGKVSTTKQNAKHSKIMGIFGSVLCLAIYTTHNYSKTG